MPNWVLVAMLAAISPRALASRAGLGARTARSIAHTVQITTGKAKFSVYRAVVRISHGAATPSTAAAAASQRPAVTRTASRYAGIDALANSSVFRPRATRTAWSPS